MAAHQEEETLDMTSRAGAEEDALVGPGPEDDTLLGPA